MQETSNDKISTYISYNHASKLMSDVSSFLSIIVAFKVILRSIILLSHQILSINSHTFEIYGNTIAANPLCIPNT